jgi:hypothetical protein
VLSGSLTRRAFLSGALTVASGRAADGRAQGPSGTLPPRLIEPEDQAGADEILAAFLADLRSAVSVRDANRLTRALSPNIQFSFDGGRGIEAFLRFHDLRNPRSTAWTELERMLRLGGVFTAPTEFQVPYLVPRWPKDLDPYEYVVALGRTVRIRAEPSQTAAVLSTVDYRILQLRNERRYTYGSGRWAAVSVDERDGFVARELIRSPIDYRATFAISGDWWMMLSFVAGD